MSSKECHDKKYSSADPSQEVTGCINLWSIQQQHLLTLLEKFQGLFDGSSSAWQTASIDVELKDATTPYFEDFPLRMGYACALGFTIVRRMESGPFQTYKNETHKSKETSSTSENTRSLVKIRTFEFRYWWYWTSRKGIHSLNRKMHGMNSMTTQK